jgi:hypothetical protein
LRFYINFIEIKIIHIFPIRGHSYNVCDTNFALVSNKLRKKPVLETPNDYLKIIEKIKKLKLIKTPVLDFDKCLSNHIMRESSVKITLMHRIDYFPNGDVIFSEDFELGIVNVNLIKTNINAIKSCFNDIEIANKSILSKDKVKDIMSLLCYLKADNRKFYIHFFSQFNCKFNNSENCNYDESDIE